MQDYDDDDDDDDESSVSCDVPTGRYLYAPSGVDVVDILLKVAQRPQPVIDIGPVDLNCPIVVCDAQVIDMPIVYCNEAFEALTGYRRHEMLGQNCRFLQLAPLQKAETGHARQTSRAADCPENPSGQADASMPHEQCAVLRTLRECITKKEEVQVAVTNFKKDGTGFLNLLSIIPVLSSHEQGRVQFMIAFMAEDKSIH